MTQTEQINQPLSIRDQFTQQVIQFLPRLSDIVPGATFPKESATLDKRRKAMGRILQTVSQDAQTLQEDLMSKAAVYNTQEFQTIMRDIHYPKNLHPYPVCGGLFLDND